MSEFTKLSLQLLPIEVKLIELNKRCENTDEIDAITSTQQQAEALLVEMNGLHRSSEKFVAKMNQKDPITNLPRFGPSMITKITKFDGDVKMAISNCQSLLSNATEIFLNAAPRTETISATYNDGDDDTLAVEEMKNMEEIATAEKLILQQQREKEEILLHEAAEQIRSQKIEYKLFLDEVRSQAICAVTQFNSRLRNITEVQRISQLLLQGILDIGARKVAIRTIASQLERIQSHPDDLALRKLRISHPALRETFTRHSESLNLLVALGFEAKLEDQANFQSVEATPVFLQELYKLYNDNNKHVHLSEALGPLDHPRWQDILSSLGLVLVCQLVEPNPEAGGKEGLQRWIKWFDDLSANTAALQAICRMID